MESLQDVIDSGEATFWNEQPLLDPAFEWIWNAFWLLSSDRQIGYSVGPIPWSAIDSFAARFSITGEEFELFQEVIRRMDSIFIETKNPSADKKNG